MLKSMTSRVFVLLSLAIPAAAAVPTYSRDVAPILNKHCVECHHANDIAPMPLISYSEVKPWATAINEAVLMHKMPPWKADPHIGKWSNDPSLSPDEIATIKAWAEGGKLGGQSEGLAAGSRVSRWVAHR